MIDFLLPIPKIHLMLLSYIFYFLSFYTLQGSFFFLSTMLMHMYDLYYILTLIIVYALLCNHIVKEFLPCLVCKSYFVQHILFDLTSLLYLAKEIIPIYLLNIQLLLLSMLSYSIIYHPFLLVFSLYLLLHIL